MSRLVTGLGIFLAVLWVASPASAAPPDPTAVACARNGRSPPGTQFQTPTGSTFLGGWAVNGSSASLCFRGVAPAGGKVVATWTTPWSRAGGYTFQAESDCNTLATA